MQDICKLESVSLACESDITHFLKLNHGMHDSCINSFTWNNPTYVDAAGAMIFAAENFPGASNLTVYFQCQSDDGLRIEVDFIGIDSLVCRGIGPSNDGIISNVEICLDEHNEIIFVCNPDDDGFFVVKAKSASWRKTNEAKSVPPRSGGVNPDKRTRTE